MACGHEENADANGASPTSDFVKNNIGVTVPY
jgi:hypothetical protein